MGRRRLRSSRTRFPSSSAFVCPYRLFKSSRFTEKYSRKIAEPRVHRGGTDPLSKEGPCTQGAPWAICGSGVPPYMYNFLNVYGAFNSWFCTSFSREIGAKQRNRGCTVRAPLLEGVRALAVRPRFRCVAPIFLEKRLDLKSLKG